MVNPKQIEDITSIFDYLQPWMDFMSSLPQDGKVVLVGHSFGGICISLAMENFPEKVLAAVFVAAFMPNCNVPLITIQQEFFRWTPMDSLMDCTFTFGAGPENLPTSGCFGSIYLEERMYLQNYLTAYRLPNMQEKELAKMLVRPCGTFLKDLAKECPLTEAKYGFINRVYVVCHDDGVTKEGFQRWVIENSPPKEVKAIHKADHVVMLSKPQELCQCLQEIAQKY
ncbi:methylesterase 10-like [Mangifera indica]|uniref:methylesterase 10-like n=1 Tax=Mangifera indica TaxID=29780 RepID=UPI001CF98F44|nr:methylesterase 10-like [Mangifera indica]